MKRYFFMLIAGVMLYSCNSTKSNKEMESSTPSKPSIEQKVFGKLPSGEEVLEFTLKNNSGIEMKVITYGGIITTLMLPDKNGKFEDVALGYDNIEGYLESTPYFGAIIGRYGNRIAKGKFSLDGTDYQLAINNIGNHLHGGEKGFDKILWTGEAMQGEESVSLKMSYISEDMEEGYPGTLTSTVVYTLNNDDELIFEYEATTDKKTVVNLTNHAYYNLAGNKGDILSHQLKLVASQYVPVDSTLIPTEIDSVKGSPFDFTDYKVIGLEIDADHEQLKNAGGFDHCWVLDKDGDALGLAASLLEPTSGRRMDVYTEEPGIQFYSGNFLDGSITGKGVTYEYRTGLCLETQHFPDSPNRPDFPSTELIPGETYKTKTVTKFLIQKD